MDQGEQGMKQFLWWREKKISVYAIDPYTCAHIFLDETHLRAEIELRKGMCYWRIYIAQ